ncbi:MAG TPA: metal ABC transporter permease [Firmicutes bacterium]|nr:metal ABC transporter permease [Bacillota bacterium]
MFMQRALVAAILVGSLCSSLSFFVVLKRLSFLGVGISHAALGGIALGVVTGLNPLLAGGAFAVATAIATGVISRGGKLSEDTVIGILYAAGMALGIALISTARGYYPELFSLLFGNILAVTSRELWMLGAVTAAVLLYICLFFKELLALCFDEEMALASGIPVTILYLGLLVAIALTVICSAQLVGTVLVSALLVIPAATGYRLSQNFRAMLAISVLVGISGSLGGLMLSYYYRIPPGASIVLAMTTMFTCSLIAGLTSCKWIQYAKIIKEGFFKP